MGRYNSLSVTKLKVEPNNPGYIVGNATFTLSSDNIVATADGSAAGMTVPAGTYVLGAFIEVTTFPNEAVTVSLGIGGSGTEFATTINVNRTAGLISTGLGGTAGIGGGKYFSVEDTIDYTVAYSSTPGTLEFKIHLLCFRT